ncbi:MAG TPA: hypothetical protein VGO67_23085 [Verrucomicrobiae bacterium]|jgi:hypothetical protein
MNRVRRLQLDVIALAGREEPCKQLAERFTRDVLGRFCDSLESRFPGRVVLVRHLQPRWALSEEEMIDPNVVSRYVVEMAESVSFLDVDGKNTNGQTPAVIFDDDASWLASYLRHTSSNATPAWYHAAWQGTGLRDFLATHSGLVISVVALLRLAATEELITILARLPGTIIIEFSQALELNIAETTQIIAGAGNHKTDCTDELGTSSTAASFAKIQHDFAILAKQHPTNMSIEAACVALYVQTLSQTLPSGANALAPTAVSAAMTAHHELIRRVIPSAVSTARIHPEPAAPKTSLDEVAPHRTTAYGGLFYLMLTALELGIGETLWKACLPEGQILAAAAAALLGPEASGDCAPALFGGITTREASEIPTILPAQQSEVCGELLASVINAFSRMDVSFPSVLLDLIETSSGRLLVAATSSFFVLFATPAPDSPAVAAGIDAFLNKWPRSAPQPEAANVLASLDSAKRFRPVDSAPKALRFWLPPGTTASTASVLLQVCGSISQIFAMRVGASSEESIRPLGSLISDYLKIAARIELKSENVTVLMPMEQINLNLRRAGLDRNPGWVPWSQKIVRFEFENVAGTHDN